MKQLTKEFLTEKIVDAQRRADQRSERHWRVVYKHTVGSAYMDPQPKAEPEAAK